MPGLLKQYLLFIFLMISVCSSAQSPVTDSIRVSADSILQIKEQPVYALDKILAENKYLNTKGTASNFAVRKRTPVNENIIFYWLAGLLVFFGLIKTFYNKYFTTLFRVFFNSSLRQSQLTDQLVQAKQPSLLYNILFFLSAGTFVYLLIQQYYNNGPGFDWVLLSGCIGLFAVIYIGKFLMVKFIAAITGYKVQGDSYVFIVFLVNKIIGICLLPINIILAFADKPIAYAGIILAIILIGLLLIFRFIRSYGSLQHKMKISGFHFGLYMIAFEILPIVVIYKAVVLYIGKIL